jgi:hypothetical protein
VSSLYRLDYESAGGMRSPVTDSILGGDYLTRNRALARCKARTEAERHPGTDIVCTRIHGAGYMRESFRVSVTHPVK